MRTQLCRLRAPRRKATSERCWITPGAAVLSHAVVAALVVAAFRRLVSVSEPTIGPIRRRRGACAFVVRGKTVGQLVSNTSVAPRRFADSAFLDCRSFA